MRFPRKVNYCILMALLLITIIFRYPSSIDHEVGPDTTFVHTMANSIVQEGYATWVLHPSSYFGLYALSYPSAVPFILATGNEVADISIEGLILILGLVLASAGVISAYIAAKLIRDDDIFACLVALLLTLAPFFLKDTTWVASSRGFVVALLPFFLLLLVKHIKTRDLRYLILSLATFLGLAAMHRMGMLAVLILIAYIFAVPLHMVTQKLRFSLMKFERPMRFAIVTIALLAFLGIFYVQFQFPGISGANVVEEYQEGTFFSGTSFPILLANMGTSSIGRVGILLPLALIGLIAYVWKRPKESFDKFLLLSIFVFFPILSLRDYIIEFAIPLFLFLVVVGLMSLCNFLKNRRQIMTVVFAGLVVSSVAFSWVMKDYWRKKYSTDRPIPNAVYDSALYIRHRNWGTTATNSGLTGGRLAAISGLPNMPLGGASTHFYSAQQLMWGFVKPENLQVRLLDLTTISLNTDEIYVPVNLTHNVEFEWETILTYGEPTKAEYNMNYYDVHFVVSDNAIFPRYTSYGYLRISCLLGDDDYLPSDPRKVCVTDSNVLPNERYVTFSNSMVTIWMAKGG